MKVKIEKFEVLHSPILTSLIQCLFLTSGTSTITREFSMKQFELQKPIYFQLFNASKRYFFCVNFFQIGCSEQSNKTHNFRKIFFVMNSIEVVPPQINSYTIGSQFSERHWIWAQEDIICQKCALFTKRMGKIALMCKKTSFWQAWTNILK